MNNITIEFSPEDRALLTSIRDALQNNCKGCAEWLAKAGLKMAEDIVHTTEPAQEPEKLEAPKLDAKPATEPEKPDAPKLDAEAFRKQIRKVAVGKIQAGHRDAVKKLLASYGAEKIDQVAEDKLEALATEIDKIGG